MTPSETITIATGVLSIIGGVTVAVRGLLSLQKHFDSRFDAIEKSFDGHLDQIADKMGDLVRRYEVDRAEAFHRDEMLSYKLNALDEKLNHKTLRFENAINQISRYLEKNHGYQPRQIFPISSEEQ